jgi:hypothetical protein
MKSLWYLLMAASLLLGAEGSLGAVWHVEQDGSGQFVTIQPAVDAAASGDTILIGPGWYQDLHQVDHFGSPIWVSAYWMDDRDLMFIGSSAEEVKIGPETYNPVNDGPQGIYNESGGSNCLTVVKSISFENLYVCAQGRRIVVDNCQFNSCRIGVIGHGPGDCSVTGSTFENFISTGCKFYNCETVEISNCTLNTGPEGLGVYFGGVGNGIVRDCTAVCKGFVYYYATNGLVENNSGTGGAVPTMVVNGGGSATIRGNHFSGGYSMLTVSGDSTFALLEDNLLGPPEGDSILIKTGARLEAHGNDFIKAYGGGHYFVNCIQYPGSGEPTILNMENNSWSQDTMPPYTWPEAMSGYIWDYDDDPELKVLIDFEPFSTDLLPTEKKSLGGLRAMFR